MTQRPGAAEIGKGSLPVLMLNEAEVERLIDLRALLDGLAEGFRAMAQGRVQAPPRPELSVPGKGFSLAMPAWMQGCNLTVKIVNVFEHNLAVGLPNHLALIALFDPQTGAPLCVLDGTYITGVRTAASAVLSVASLARPDARVATVVGAGVQGREHLRLLPLVRDFAEIRLASLYPEDAEALARRFPGVRAVTDIEAAVRSADVVCLASHAYEPVIRSDWVRPGTHVTSVGYAPPRGELPTDLLERATLYVETEAAFEPPPVGCAELAGLAPSAGIRLGDMLTGTAPGRVSDQQVTVYKAMGIAMEDMVAAHIAYTAALRDRVGQHVAL
ncbi:ornithine cyclodeaminase family protein [Rhodoligotrophos defluvii]|uniref:ornithine cyclodeaminase family protein n=1 Tax=Rhodoligotrophos defluvii TaxID=2561934 RepID=UPI0010C98020|nr:ornithine cyclodeaminase family protein [Rhodoligotrophos defluvii]